jgi:hypothetical protein
VLRLIGFFVATLVLLNLLRTIPVIGDLFHGIFAFWIVAIGLSIAMSKLADVLLQRRRLRNSIRALGAVDRPHNHWQARDAARQSEEPSRRPCCTSSKPAPASRTSPSGTTGAESRCSRSAATRRPATR